VSTFIHTFPVRVYYEDTDHGGVVYYANYLKFMERGRTEFLRDAGLELDELESADDTMFAVTEAHVRYLEPAHFNDMLSVDSKLIQAGGARLAFRQNIRKHRSTLVEAEIRLACMRRNGHPRRIPAEVLHLMQSRLVANSSTGVEK